jgi:hypothetical protein
VREHNQSKHEVEDLPILHCCFDRTSKNIFLHFSQLFHSIFFLFFASLTLAMVNDRKRAKKAMSLVSKGRKLQPEDVRARVGALLGGAEQQSVSGSERGSSAGGHGPRFLAKVAHKRKVVGEKTTRKVLEVAGAKGKREVTEVVTKEEFTGPLRTVEEAQGIKLLHRAVKNQSHNRPLPHQTLRHDYEYRLRKVATAGVVCLFNSLAQAQKVGAQAMEEAEQTVTVDKAQEKKLIASREAFLSALRHSQPAQL